MEDSFSQGDKYDSSANSQLKTLERLRTEVAADVNVFKELYKRAKLDTTILFSDDSEKFSTLYAVRNTKMESRIQDLHKYSNNICVYIIPALSLEKTL